MTSGAPKVGAVRVTVDAGNGSAKFVSFDDGRRALGSTRLEYGDDFESRACELLRGARRVALSCVAGAAVRSALERAAALAGARLEDVAHGLDLSACRHVHTIGADRLWAARGALELVGAPCLVIDVGTAVTVDAVGASGAGGAFLGGAIAPGPQLLRRALGAGAAQLFEVDLPSPSELGSLAGVPALGRESAQALRSGIVHGLRGAVRELAALVASEAGITGAPCVVTGGAAGFVLVAPPVVDGACHEPLLVHLGLLAALGSAPA